MNEEAYCGAKIEIFRKYKNGNLDVKIFPNKDGCSFIRSRFSEKGYKNVLNEIENGKFNL